MGAFPTRSPANKPQPKALSNLMLNSISNSNFYLNFALFQANNFRYLRSIVLYTIEKNIKLIFKESHNGV
jgi:hypothetical protein